MSDEQNLKAARAFFDAWNAGDLSRTDAYEAESLESQGPGAPGPMNREQNRAYTQNFLTAFPGSQFNIWLTISEGDYVASHWNITGKHAGPLLSPTGDTIPPTGRTVTLTGVTTSEVKNGKVVRTWNFWDMASFLGQLGLMPSM